MPAQPVPSAYTRMLWKLIETHHTLTRLLSLEYERSGSHGRAQAGTTASLLSTESAQTGATASDADIPIESTPAALLVSEAQEREPEHIIPSFDPIPPGKLGTEIVKFAQTELARPVKEEFINGAPANFDREGHIKKYFIEGPRWKAETWDSYTEKHGGIGPAWCAAFVSFCWRSAHRGLGVELPFKLNAQCSVLWNEAHSTQRFIPKSSTPSPGDIVFLGSGESPGHVGIVEKVDSEGIIYIIEGNAGEKTDQMCRSRLIPGKPRYAKLMGFAAAELP